VLASLLCSGTDVAVEGKIHSLHYNLDYPAPSKAMEATILLASEDLSADAVLAWSLKTNL
jgi:hypothetical protein